jgi:long-chain-fatty-acid---luciferin-component ligase
MVLEGYSMTEINMLMMRCEHGRFHIPPIIEPVIFNEELEPLEGSALKGAFGFLDPLASSYPGFIISNDYVHLVEGVCGCGLAGPAITEIGRLSGSEIKGCGGIMASMHV